MHGCNSVSALFVNAEVDSMGGVVDGGVGIGLKTSPRRAAIEKAQAELRQEYDVREERRRELEFLEKGGNPLDFKFGNASSVSVQSTSLTDQHHDLFLNSEAKGSVALTASPHGDSVDSSARPGAASVSEPNTADNLLLFEGENELPEGDKRSLHLIKRDNVTRSEQSSRIDGSQNAKESEDSAIFRPYERRNRSRPNHASRGSSWDGKGLISDKSNQKDHNLPSVSKPKSASVNGDMVTKDPKSPLDNDLHGVRAHQTAFGNSVPADKLNITFTINSKEDQRTVQSQDDTAQNPVIMDIGEANAVEEREPVASADLEVENETCSGQQNGFGNIIDSNGLQNQGQDSGAASGMKNFESESFVQANSGRDVYSDSDMHTNTKSVDVNGSAMEQTLGFEKKQDLAGCEVVKERSNANNGRIAATVNNELDVDHQNHSGGDNVVKAEEDKNTNSTLVQNEVNDSTNTKGVQYNDHTVLVGHLNSNQDNCCGRPQGPTDVSNCELPQAEKVSTATSDCQPCSSHHLKLPNKAHEDSILEEARIIEAKRKRIAELSIRVLPTQNSRKSHWDFVLEEMAWLANDFAQERIWKINAAAQLCHRAALKSRLRFEEQNKKWGIKTLAHIVAKAVMQFWHSIELLDNADPGINCIDGTVESGKVDTYEASSDKRRNSYTMLETSKDLEGLQPRKSVKLKVQAYALRFLKNNSSYGISSQAVAPMTPDRLSDSGIVDVSWDDHLTEESLFYTVPSNAMETYRKSVESHFLQCEKTGTSIQGESETIMYDTVTEFGPEEIAYEEDEGETGAYYLPGVYEGIKSSKSVQKKHKHMMKSHIPRSYEVGAEVPYGHYATGTQQSMLIGKRPASLNVGPIRKRMRTASRQRVFSPFTAVVTGSGQAQAKTDASSGDTNSFQDDQSTLHGGSQIQKSVEVDSVGDFEKQLPYDCAETSIKIKKKKKAKNLGSAYDHGWQLDSVVLNEQRDHYHKRLDSHHFESNGTSGLYGQHNAKKLKIMKQPPDTTVDNITPMTGSIPSPAASQMSNMSNQSKFIRIISGRDRGRKAKALKISAGQPGFGSPWSLFEDQALVVLVHDMGPNWELVSDAINSALQFKCIFRKPKECKERHRILMDKSSGDGADSAEDSGCSQPYPSTLPGIPKGSARQLFQRLQGPMEEDTLKSHFEKIIRIGQKLHYRRNQNENQDLIVNVHNSHLIVCPNNLSGDILTPLDLCDSNASTPELGHQDSHAGGMALSNQGSVPSLSTSGVNSSLPGSSSMVLGSNLSSTSGSITTSVRDSRFGVPRGSTLSVDEHQRVQQYNPMLSGRNLQQSTMPVPGSLSGSDRGVRMLPGGNNMGMMGGISRNVALSRPGFQGMASSSMLTSGSMHSSSVVGMPSPVNMHSGVGTGPGNPILRPREAIHMMRPGHNPEHQRQMTVPELQMQVTQANSPGVAAFNGLSSAFSNQTTQPPIQPYTGHAQQPHQMSQQQSHLSNSHSHLQGPNHTTSSQHQAYAIRLAKERQLQQQQRYLQHQQQQFAASNALMPQVQSQSQLPISSALQNSSQVQSQNSSQQVSLSPVTPSSPLTPMSSHHQQQKHHLPQHGFSRNPSASGLTNQSVKQRQRQPQQQQYQQPSRQHPNQRQNAQSQQQAKLLKGIGRGNMVHQNLSVDPSHLNGLSMPPGNQTADKGDSMMHMMQGQNLYPGSGVNPIQSPKPLASAAHSSSYSQLPQKLHSGPAPTSKQHQPLLSPDSSAQAQVLPVTSGHMLSLPQAIIPPTVASNHNQMQLQSQPQSKQINQTQSNMQRMLQQNRQMHSESPSRSQSDPAQVDQQPTKSVSQISTSCAMTQGCVDTANVVPAFPTVSPQWKISEPPYDSNMPNSATQVGSLGSAPVGNSAGNEPLPTISQGLGPKQISVSLPSHAHNTGAQWPHQPALPHQQSLLQPILPQQPYQSQEQQQKEREQHSPKHGALQHQPQQQVQHLQPGQGGLFMTPPKPNSKAE